MDNISKMPDLILTDVLSRLTAKEVIQTCILSKRWSKLWTLVPCLDFRFSEFKGEERTQENHDRDLKRFENFVSSFLHLRNDAADLHTFSLLHWRYGTNARLSGSAVVAWLCYASKHNLKNLRIVLGGDDNIQVPDCLFICDSLEDVELSVDMVEGKMEIKPDFVNLPRLRTLYICWGSLNRDCMEKLIFGCPILEKLSVLMCDLKMSNISSRTLKYLCITDCNFETELIPPIVSISGPNIDFLDISVKLTDSIKLRDMSKVTTAIIKARCVLPEGGVVANHGYEFLSCLSNVEKLHFVDCNYLMEMLKRELPKCRTFVNMKALGLRRGCMYCEFGVLCSFLKHCPHLEYLYISHRSESCQGRHGQEGLVQELEKIEKFSLKRLTVIQIGYKVDDHLDVGRVLELLQNKMETDGVPFSWDF